MKNTNRHCEACKSCGNLNQFLSLILAFVLLMSIFTAQPPTAYAEEMSAAEISAQKELADTGDDIIINIYNATQLRTHLEAIRNDNTAIKLVLMNDISEYIGEGYTSTYPEYHPDAARNGDSNRIPVWCTVGKGQKVIDLNNHNVYLRNLYTAIYDDYDKGLAYCERKSNQCLFSIPKGASLTVNGGGTSNTETGSIVYDGIILNQCDGVDQRDIFHVDGGSLTVNSGRFAPADNNHWYTSPYHTTQQINGTAITVKTGDLTVNGGYFEGRGMNSYSFKSSSGTWDLVYPARNGALEIKGGKVTVNDGHFVGVGSGSAVIDTSYGAAENHYYSGHFTVAYDHTWYAVQHDKNAPQYFDGGIIGIKLSSLDPNTNYYIAPYDPITSAAEITDISDLRYHNNNLQPVDFYIRPKSEINEAFGAPKVNNKEITFLRGNTPVKDDETWNLNLQNNLDVDPAALYFPIIDNTYSNDGSHGKEVRQTLPVTISVYEYISEGNRPAVTTGISYSAKKRSDDPTDTWQIDLNEAIPAATMNKLQNGHDYVIVFEFRELFTSQNRTQTVTHYADYYFTAAGSGGYTVSGTVTSFLNSAHITWIGLGKVGSLQYLTSVTGNNASYSIPDVAAGTYIMAVSKNNHVTRTYEITVSGNTTQDVKICPIGDADSNGRVNSADAKRTSQHANGQIDLKVIDPYQFACADTASPKGKINSADAKAISQHANDQKSLWT